MSTFDRLEAAIRSLGDDLFYAGRSLRRHPIFFAFVIGVIACGFSLSLSAMGLLDRLLLRPPDGVVDSDRLLRVIVHWSSPSNPSAVRGLLTPEEYRRIEAQVKPPTQLFAYTQPESVTAVLGGHAQRIAASLVTAGYFDGLGLGSLSRAPLQDTGVNAIATPRVIVGHAFWEANKSVRTPLREEIQIRGNRFQIAGIAGRDFHGLDIGATDVWLPVQGGARALGDSLDVSRSDAYVYHGVVRVPNGADVDRLSKEFGSAIGGAVSLTSISAARRVEVSQSSFAVFIAIVSTVVMLLSAVAAMTLVVMRSQKRGKEYAIRSAIGAPPARVVREILLEMAAVLTLAAAGSALLMPRIAEVFRLHVTPELYRGAGWWDVRTIGLLLIMLFLIFAVSAIVPIRSAISLRIWALLAEQPSTSRASSAIDGRRLIIAAQVAVSFLLIAAGGLFIQSFRKALSSEYGIDYTGLYYLPLSGNSLVEPAAQQPAVETLTQKLRSIPGVEAAGVSNSLPFMSQTMVLLRLPDHRPFPIPPNGGPYLNLVTPGYLTVMGTSLLAGRPFSNADTADAPPVAIINESMARTVWPGGDAIGRCFSVLVPPVRCYQVVGIARDTHTTGLRSGGAMQYYLPFAQTTLAQDTLFLLVRATKPNEETIAQIGRVLKATRSAEVTKLRAMRDLIEPDVAPLSLAARFLSFFAVFALFFAVTGIYGIVTHSLWAQRKELGIRMSLGGSPQRLLLGVLADSVVVTGWGLIVGAIAAATSFPLVRSLLFATAPYDPLSVTTAFIVIIVSTLFAASVGAWRYLRLEPAQLMTMP